MKKHPVNWHEAAVCAIQIELHDYAHLFEFHSEHVLGKKNYRIDLLIVHKLPSKPVPINFARIFKDYNIFEIKGAGSSLTVDSYYKVNGYAGFLINTSGNLNQYTRQNISLSFLTLQYPRKLFKHLTNDCKLVLEKISSGIYHINNDIYQAQVLVTSELSPEENLYLHCIRKNFNDIQLAERLASDYNKHIDQEIYTRYMNQLTNASIDSKGESPMVCEGILNICGTSSKEIEEKTKAIYIPQINKLTEEAKKANLLIASQANEIAYLKSRLALYESN